MTKLEQIQHLVKLLDYDRETGELRWNHNKGRRAYKGFIAGHKDKKGYLHIGVKIYGKPYTVVAHQIVFYIEHGRIPIWPKQIDHDNNIPWDNRHVNLVETTPRGNLMRRVKNQRILPLEDLL